MTLNDLVRWLYGWFQREDAEESQALKQIQGINDRLDLLISHADALGAQFLKEIFKMADDVKTATEELTADAGIMTAAVGALDALLTAEEALKTQLAAATDPTAAQALTDASTKAAAARAALQAELDKANPPAPAKPENAPAAAS